MSSKEPPQDEETAVNVVNELLEDPINSVVELSEVYSMITTFSFKIFTVHFIINS